VEELIFEGLKVVEVSSWIAAPVAGAMLATRGAEVTKVEVPVDGDGYRNFSTLVFTPNADANYAWLLDNHHKRSITINLKTEEGKQILHKMIAECDVYITNQPLGMRRSFGLDYEDIQHLNERMIYASLSPYGEQGPDHQREAFDLAAYWNRSGLLNKMRQEGNEPVQAVPGMGDHPTGVALYASIVTALLARERTGKGTKVHTSLLANGVWSAACLLQAKLANADFSHVPGQRLTGALYEASDGRWIQISMIRTPELIDTLMIAMEAFDLIADERFVTVESRQEYADVFTELLRERFKTRPSHEWIQLLRVEHDLPVDLVATFDEVTTDPHIALNNMVLEPAEDIGMDQVISDPVNVDGLKKLAAKRAPDMGEHTDDVLRELGYSADDIASLRDNGIV